MVECRDTINAANQIIVKIIGSTLEFLFYGVCGMGKLSATGVHVV
jgi:hypothetical protein